jgi:hypothetical protein
MGRILKSPISKQPPEVLLPRQKICMEKWGFISMGPLEGDYKNLPNARLVVIFN